MTGSPGDQGHIRSEATRLVEASTEAIIERMEAAAARARAADPDVELLLAFDGDGTLWSGDIGVEVFEALLARGPSAIREAAREPLRVEAERHGVAWSRAEHEERGGDAHAIAVALHRAFLEGRYPEREAYAMHAWVFAGWTFAELDRFVDESLSAGRIDERHRPRVVPFIEWASRSGASSFIVSASPRASVRRAAAKLGVPDARILAMTPASSGGAIEPRIEGVVTYGDGKLKALREARPNAKILGAFGDSAWDAAMMRASSVPVAVYPGPSLLAVAGSIPDLVVLSS